MAATPAAAPNAPALPAPPPADFWDETQWAVFMALMDAVVPSVVPESADADPGVHVTVTDAEFAAALAAAGAPDRDAFAAFLADRPSASAAFRDSILRTLPNIPAGQRRQLGGALTALSTRAGALVLTGSCTPVHLQPARAREAVVRAWFRSWVPAVRFLAKSVTTLAQLTYVTTSPLFRRVSGYPDVPPGWRAGPGFPFAFLQFPPAPGTSSSSSSSSSSAPPPEPATLETDVVIVGSGCGGAVAAKVLAEAGHRVLVAERGYHFAPAALPMPQEAAQRHLFDNGGFYSSAPGGAVNAVAGACWGGGGTVNWSVCLQTQGYVRDEWAGPRGLPFFATQAFQDCLDRVCAFMGADDAAPVVRQSHRGAVVLEGSRRLGWRAAPAPQNTAGQPHDCGHCHLGCGSAAKRGPAVSWLPAAARAGARFVEGFQVDRVLFDDEGGAPGARRAVGVVGKWTSRDADGGVSGPPGGRVTREVVVRAKKVIVACGSMWSPVVLLNSGLKNRHIGMNLHLHPCNMAGGFYKEDIRPWEEAIITSYCSSFENLDGQGHGTKLESTCMIPYTTLANLPWRGGLDFKLDAARYRRFDAFISLTRDRDAGRVLRDPATGRPVLDYTPSAFDRAHTLEGVLAICKLLYITGAAEIRAFLPGTEPFVRAGGGGGPKAAAAGERAPSVGEGHKEQEQEQEQEPRTGEGEAKQAEEEEEEERLDLGVSDPAFSAWLARVRAAGNASPDAPFSSAHQMGSCRMSTHEGDGVVDSRGRVWGTEGLFVADASVFPSASGVNPMVTVMAIADWIARGVARELKA